MEQQTRDRLSQLLVGMEIINVEQYGNYFHMMFASRSLTIRCAWRLICDGEIVIGSGSTDELVDRMSDYLKGQVVERVAVRGEFHDLRLEFMSRYALEVYADSQEFENWQLGGGPTEMIIAGPSRLWSEF